ncbi:sugar phosphate isomerase/epimerase family protein [Halotalea alkalilenta]|uniref:sugar phosphate isomerase/epimerase family protein n=1 Tax=Halotalea alkalilenta TaxID=376489 RepID=UPI00047FBC07|nr:TIM barrel protein [Halotalea alkalilenta]
MQLSLFKSLWGHRGAWSQALPGLRAGGFGGFEARPPSSPDARREARRLLEEEGLDYIAVLFTSDDIVPRQADTPARHLADLEARIEIATPLAPSFLNLLVGNDRWPLGVQVEFFGRALELLAGQPIAFGFETHRARSLATPWLTLELIRQLPGLRFTSDISHWVVCCERLLDDPLDDLSAFVERVDHIQARVGYDQGPQVPHPLAPEYARFLAFHQRHWEAVWQAQRARGFTRTTLTPEFGPDGYLHHLPFTDAPIADLDQLNAAMARCEREHFAHAFSS